VPTRRACRPDAVVSLAAALGPRASPHRRPRSAREIGLGLWRCIPVHVAQASPPSSSPSLSHSAAHMARVSRRRTGAGDRQCSRFCEANSPHAHRLHQTVCSPPSCHSFTNNRRPTVAPTLKLCAARGERERERATHKDSVSHGGAFWCSHRVEPDARADAHAFLSPERGVSCERIITAALRVRGSLALRRATRRHTSDEEDRQRSTLAGPGRLRHRPP